MNVEQQEMIRRKKLFQDYLHSDEYQEKLIQRLQINDACIKKPEARKMTWHLCARPDNPAGMIYIPVRYHQWIIILLIDHVSQPSPRTLNEANMESLENFRKHLEKRIQHDQKILQQVEKEIKLKKTGSP